MSAPDTAPRAAPAASTEKPEESRSPSSAGARAFRLTPEPPRVMRLSRKALAVIGSIAACTTGGLLIYALKTPRKIEAPNLVEAHHAARPDVVASAPGSYDKVPQLGPPLPGDLGRPFLDARQNGQALAPTSTTMAPVDPHQAAADELRQRHMQEVEAARESRLFLLSSAATAGAPAASSAGSGMPATTTPSPIAAQTGALATETAGQAANRAFLQTQVSRVTISAQQVDEPSSPYLLQAGSVIAAALITGIRSDLPGQITAQVTQNVYDSLTGQLLLIPQGSRLIGEYDSQLSAGQTRVLLAWDRLILPDGRSLILDRQPGADASGFAGLQDKTNHHWGNMLRAAAVSTLLGVGTQMATDNNDALVQAFRYGTQDTINQVGKQLVQREINIPPTLTIRPGLPLRVILTRDLIIQPRGGGQ